jgi:MFS family permease
VLVRARIATSLLFLLFGVTLGTWTVRIPAVKHELSLSDGWLSIALLAFAAGAITGMQATGRAVDRFGSRAVLIPVAIGEGLVLIPPGYMPDLAALAGALFIFGAVHGTLNIAMNAHAIEVQRAWQRPIMSSFHAVYSIGGFLGATVGGFFAQAGVGAATTFVVVGAAMVVLALGAAFWTLPAGNTGPTESAGPESAGPTESAIHAVPGGATPATPANGGRLGRVRNSVAVSGVLFLGALAFCTLVGEGAAADWSAVYLRDTLHSTAGFAAAAYAAFSVMMTVGRLTGDRLAARLGPVRLVRRSGVLAAVGLAGALLIGHPIAGVIGFGALGAGMSCIAPQVYSIAGNRDPARAGRALGRVISIGYLGFLTGPIIIGGASTAVGLRAALAIPVVLCLFVSLSASALRPAPKIPHQASPSPTFPHPASREQAFPSQASPPGLP